jgi:outer membrane protein assembly factor BamB
MGPKRDRSAWSRAFVLTVGVLTVWSGTMAAVPASATPYVNWPAYLGGPSHNSYLASATAITPADAASLTPAWTFMPGAPPDAALGYQLNASPTVYDGVVYIGANNGTFYALDEATGATLWQTFLGYVDPEGSCGTRGITATATVAADPSTGVPTVYVSGGDGYLYALNAATGTVLWKSVIALPVGDAPSYYDWSSPTVMNNRIYVGVAAQCTEHERGGMLEFGQTRGKLIASYYTVPSDMVGGSIWSSAAVASNGDVYAGSGNDLPPTPSNEGTSESIIELKPDILHQLGSWQLPLTEQPSDDDDFGASASLFDAVPPGTATETAMVGACDKNGVYYALRQDDVAAGPVWSQRIAAVNKGDDGMTAACLASTVVDGNHLYVAGTATTIDGTKYNGSIREVNASTGKVLWSTGLPEQVIGTPSLDGAGVIAVATLGYGSSATNADYLIDASTGAILATLDNGNSPQFAQPVFADGYLFAATETAGLIAYQLPG